MQLPPELWGHIYGLLESKEDRMNLFHTCKTLHEAPDIKKQIKKLTMHLSGDAEQGWANLKSSITSYPSAHLQTLIIQIPRERARDWNVQYTDIISEEIESIFADSGTFPFITELIFDSKGCLSRSLEISRTLQAFPGLTSLSFLDCHINVQALQHSSLTLLRELVIAWHSCEIVGLAGYEPLPLSELPLVTLVLPSYFRATDQAFDGHFPALRNLRFTGLDAEDLLSLKHDLERGVFPYLTSLVIDKMTLFSAFKFSRELDYPQVGKFFIDHPEELQGLLETLEKGASVFSLDQVRLSPSFGCMWFYSDWDLEWVLGYSENATFENETIRDATIRVYLLAFQALIRGGMHTVAASVRELHLDCLYVCPPFLQLCALYFTSVEKLVLGPRKICDEDYDEAHWLCGPLEWCLPTCIISFPSLRLLTLRDYVWDAEIKCEAKVATNQTYADIPGVANVDISQMVATLVAVSEHNRSQPIHVKFDCCRREDAIQIKNAYERCVPSVRFSRSTAVKCVVYAEHDGMCV